MASAKAHPEKPLDELALEASRGDRAAEEALFAVLRVRLLDVAKRRVREADREDVVQEALRVVHAKHATRSPQRGFLIWSMAVLRNVIGNYYQKQRRRDATQPFDERLHTPAAEAVIGRLPHSEGDVSQLLLAAIKDLAHQEPRCGEFFGRILESLDQGGSPREISQRAFARIRERQVHMSRNSLYVALHRCRQRLRDILARMI